MRRDRGRDTSILAATPGEQAVLAGWLGFADEAAFRTEHIRRLHETRTRVLKLLDSGQT